MSGWMQTGERLNKTRCSPFKVMMLYSWLKRRKTRIQRPLSDTFWNKLQRLSLRIRSNLRSGSNFRAKRTDALRHKSSLTSVLNSEATARSPFIFLSHTGSGRWALTGQRDTPSGTLTGMGGMSVEKQLGPKTAMALYTTSATASQIFCTYLIPWDYTDIFLNCARTISLYQALFCKYFLDNAENNAF